MPSLSSARRVLGAVHRVTLAGVESAEAALRADREETLRRIDALSTDFSAIVAAVEGVATDDEHDPEGATIAFERAQVDALLRGARDHLAAIDRALDRVAAGAYGRCSSCGEAIAAERLAARPVAETCARCAGGLRRR